jgi:hypothetical protein
MPWSLVKVTNILKGPAAFTLRRDSGSVKCTYRYRKMNRCGVADGQ